MGFEEWLFKGPSGEYTEGMLSGDATRIEKAKIMFILREPNTQQSDGSVIVADSFWFRDVAMKDVNNKYHRALKEIAKILDVDSLSDCAYINLYPHSGCGKKSSDYKKQLKNFRNARGTEEYNRWNIINNYNGIIVTTEDIAAVIKAVKKKDICDVNKLVTSSRPQKNAVAFSIGNQLTVYSIYHPIRINCVAFDNKECVRRLDMSEKIRKEYQNESNGMIVPEIKKWMDNLHSPLGNAAMKSLYDAGLNAETIEKFQLGYDAAMESRSYNRVITPHYDENGKLCGYTGRAVDGDTKPKYVSYFPDSLEVRPLFGINLAVKSAADYFILCEGEIDAMLIHQNGFDSAVALTWTCLKESQAEILKRYKNNVIIFYDNDATGKRGAIKAANVLENSGIIARIISFKEIPDPATLMRRDNGREKLAVAIANC